MAGREGACLALAGRDEAAAEEGAASGENESSPSRTPAQILDDYEVAARIKYGKEDDLPNPRAEEQLESMACREASLRYLNEFLSEESMTEEDPVDHAGEWKRLKERRCEEEEEDGGKEAGITVGALYPALGWVLIRDLSVAFYDNVWCDTADWFRSQFQREFGKEHEVLNQWTFFVEAFGGPKVFEVWRNVGGEELVEFTHTSQGFNMTAAGLTRWLSHLAKAMRTVGMLEKCPGAVPIILEWSEKFGKRMVKSSGRL